MQVRWAPSAAKDLQRIFRRIERENPSAARKVIKTIYDSCVSLKDFPNRGRPGRMEGRRELTFPGLPYVAVYKVTSDAVEISRVWHGAQDWR
ncbi:MAG: type II toxin-antitoxin system RelE/ParE family toxin [Verrucomicrobia bacterium]|nr:type II toxin-antitoxin system RelE/ParE family toxin [Verrucomicrobiota bacterium]